MTVDELLEMNPRLGHVARYMAEHPDIPVRFWDNGTVDLTIPPKAKLGQFLGSFRCPSCGNPVEGRSVPDKDTMKGTFRECRGCGIRFFIHNEVKFGGS